MRGGLSENESGCFRPDALHSPSGDLAHLLHDALGDFLTRLNTRTLADLVAPQKLMRNLRLEPADGS